MATTIDEKVVQMKFDNRDFEKNVKTSMSTLDKLKAKLHLDGVSKGLENVSAAAKKVNMNGIANGIQTVQTKFSAMEVIGVTALANITNSAVNAGKQLVKSLSVDQVSSGWNKMNQKIGSVQTLVNSTGLSVEEIDEYLSQLMWYSDETSYSFTDMTASLAQMTSTGGDIKKLVPMIRGIANATAYAGKGAAEFSRVIYNLNQSYGAGYLQLMDWKSVQLAGANSKQLTEELIKAGEELGTIKKGQITIGNFNESLKDKWATTEVMEKAFARFDQLSAAAYEAVEQGFVEMADGTKQPVKTCAEAIDLLSDRYDDLAVSAFRSAQEAKSFREAIDATADATSSAWMEIFSAIFGGYNEQKRIFTDLANWLYEVFVDPLYSLEEVVRNAFDFSGFEAMWNKLTDNSVVKTATKVADAVKTTTKTLQEYQDVVKKVWRGDFNNRGDNPDRFDLLTKAGWDPKVVQELVNQTDKMAGYGKGWTVIGELTIDDVRKAEEKYGIAVEDTTKEVSKQVDITEDLNKKMQNLTEKQLNKLGLDDEEINMYQSLQRASKKYGISMDDIIKKMSQMSGRDLVFGQGKRDDANHVDGIFNNIAKALGNVANAAKTAWAETFKPFGGAELYMIINNLWEFTNRLKEASGEEKFVRNLTDAFKGLFSILKLVTTIMGGGIKIAFTIFKTVCQTLGYDMLDVAGAMGNVISKVVNFITENEFLIKGIVWLTKTIAGVIVKIHDWITSFVSLNGILHGIENALNKFKNTFSNWIKGLKDVKGFKNIVSYIFQGLINGFTKGASKVWAAVSGFFAKLIQIAKDKLGINSPSKVFYAMGGFIVVGLIKGILGAFGSLKSGMGTFVGWIGGLFKNNIANRCINGFIDGIQNGGASVWDTLKKWATNIVNVVKNVLGIHSPSTVFFAIGGFLIAGLLAGMKSQSMTLFDALAGIGNKIIEIFKGIDLSSLFIMGATGGLIYGYIKLAKGIDILAGGLQNLNGVISGVRSVLSGFRNVLDKFKVKIITSSIKDVAISIAILVGSIAVLTLLDVGKVWASIGAIAALMAVLGAFTVLVGKFGKAGSKDFGKLALTILAVGVAMSLMAGALKKISKIENLSIGPILAFGALMAGLMGLMYIVTKNDKSAVKMAGTILAIGVVFKLMASTVKSLGKIPVQQLIQGTIAIGVFSLLIVGLIAATKLLTGSKNVDKIGGALLKISTAFLLMGMVVKSLGKLDQKQLIQGMAAITVFEGLIIGLMAATKLLVGSKNVGKIGGMIGGIAAAFLAMALCVKLMGGMKPEELVKGSIMLAVFTAIVGAIVLMTKKYSGQVKNVGIMMFGIAAAMAVMAIAVMLISMLSWEGLAKGLVGIGVLTLFIVGIMKATEKARNVYKTVLAFTAVIGVISLAIGLLSIIDPKRLVGPTLAMGALMAMTALLIKVTKNLSQANWKSVAVQLGLITLVIGVLAGIVVGLSFINADNAIKACAALGILALVMVGMLATLSLVKVDTSSILTALIGMAGLVVALYAVIGALALMQGIENATQNALVLGAFMAAMTICLIGVAAVGAIYALTGGVAMLGLVGLLGIMASIYLLIGALALMNAVPNAMTNTMLLTGFMSVMCGMLTQLAIVGPLALIGVTALTALMALMPILILFATAIGALVTYIPQLEEFMNKGMQVMINLAGGLGEMIGAFVNGVLTQISAGLPEIGSNLSAFMINATPFIVGAKMVNDATLKGVGILTAAILALTAGQLISGITKLLPFCPSLAELGMDLSMFMMNATPFIMGARLIDDSVAKSIKALSSAVLSLTASSLLDGIKNFLGLGGGSLGEFGNQLGPLGSSLATFVANLGTFDEGTVATVDCAGKAITALADAAEKLPNEGGLWAALAGDNSLATFAENLPTIGTNIKDFVANLGKFDEDQVKTAECAGKTIVALAEAASKIPNEGGLWAKIAGDNSLADFAGKLPDVAGGINGFVTALGDFGDKTDSVNAAAEVIKGLANLADKGADKDKGKKLTAFGKELSGFGDNLKSFITKMASVSKDDTELAAGNTKVIVEAANSMMKTISDNITNKSTDVVAAAEEVGKKTAKGFYNDSVKTEIATQAKNFVTGFADGIKNNKSLAESAAREVAQKALDASQKKLDEHSPSKETERQGSFFGEGFVLGIKKYSSRVYDVSGSMADEAKRGLANSISKISNLVETEVDTNPTIRPVLDLTEVADGAGRINSMLNTQDLGVSANLNSISSGMNAKSQNGRISDVVSSIDKLGKNLGNTQSNVYNINGISTNGNTAVEDAVNQLINALEIERRV